jgi:hypothetical protein
MIYSKDVKMKQTAVLDCHRTLFVHVAPPSPSHTHTHTHTHTRARVSFQYVSYTSEAHTVK